MQAFNPHSHTWADPNDERAHRLGVDLALYDAIVNRVDHARSLLKTPERNVETDLRLRADRVLERLRALRVGLESRYPSDTEAMRRFHDGAIALADRAEELVRQMEGGIVGDKQEIESRLVEIERMLRSIEALHE